MLIYSRRGASAGPTVRLQESFVGRPLADRRIRFTIKNKSTRLQAALIIIRMAVFYGHPTLLREIRVIRGSILFSAFQYVSFSAFQFSAFIPVQHPITHLPHRPMSSRLHRYPPRNRQDFGLGIRYGNRPSDPLHHLQIIQIITNKGNSFG